MACCPSGRVVHPSAFRTPWISTLLVGGFVAVFAALIPIDILGELVSIGTSAGIRHRLLRRVDLA